MTSGTIQLEVVAPDRRVLQIAVDEVVLPGSEGYLGVRPGHTPLLTALGIGELSYVQAGQTQYLALAQGFAEILPDRVSVLCKAAETPGEIDVSRAEASKTRAERSLSEAAGGVDDGLDRAEVRLKRALNRITVARTRSGG